MYKYYFNENNYLQKIFPKHNFLFILLNISHINSFLLFHLCYIFFPVYIKSSLCGYTPEWITGKKHIVRRRIVFPITRNDGNI